jgi:hypothetical protein
MKIQFVMLNDHQCNRLQMKSIMDLQKKIHGKEFIGNYSRSRSRSLLNLFKQLVQLRQNPPFYHAKSKPLLANKDI